jgi:hypothetical protein
MRIQRIIISCLGILYHSGFSILIINAIQYKTNCTVPKSFIIFTLVSHIMWFANDLYTMITIHPSDVTGSDKSRETYRRYSKDLLFSGASTVLRVLMIIIASVLISRNNCYKTVSVIILIEVIMYIYITIIMLCVLEPLYGGKVCYLRFKGIYLDPETVPILQA